MSELRPLPESCERALLEQFLKAESMALRLVRSSQAQDVPAEVLRFLRRHEEEEDRHLRQFEELLGTTSRNRTALPRTPRQWFVLAVQLYGYEALGLEFAKLLATLRPDLADISSDEEVHVSFFEHEVSRILDDGGPDAEGARHAASAWRRRLPRTIDNYLRDDAFAELRDDLRRTILGTIDRRFADIGLSTSAVL